MGQPSPIGPPSLDQYIDPESSRLYPNAVHCDDLRRSWRLGKLSLSRNWIVVAVARLGKLSLWSTSIDRAPSTARVRCEYPTASLFRGTIFPADNRWYSAAKPAPRAVVTRFRFHGGPSALTRSTRHGAVGDHGERRQCPQKNLKDCSLGNDF